MRGGLTRLAVAVAGAVLLALSAALPASAGAQERTVKDVPMGDEAWFFRYRQPLEPVPETSETPVEEIPEPLGGPVEGARDNVEAIARTRTNPYASEETLHVAVDAGREQARTYVKPQIPLKDGLEGIVTGGTMTFVEAGAKGSFRPEKAQMLACLTTEFIVSDQGGDWEKRYSADCDRASSALRLQKGKDDDPPTWTVDLAPFAAAWEDPFSNYGVAIVADPDDQRRVDEQTWHVTFANQFNGTKDAKPITADLRLRFPELPPIDFDPTPPPPPPDGPPPPPPAGDPPAAPPAGGLAPPAVPAAPSAGSRTPVTGPPAPPPVQAPPARSLTGGGGPTGGAGSGGGTTGGFAGDTAGGSGASGGSAPRAQSLAQAPAVREPLAAASPQQPTTAPQVAAPAQQTVPASIPGTPMALWLLPLLGLPLAAALGWSLLQPVELANQREGAVSRLMRLRRSSTDGATQERS